jgi:hypothetical protein
MLLGLRGHLSCAGGGGAPLGCALKPLYGELDAGQLRAHLHHLPLSCGAGNVRHTGTPAEEHSRGEEEKRAPPRREASLY